MLSINLFLHQMNQPVILHINTALKDAYIGFSKGDEILGYLSNDNPLDHASFVQSAIKKLSLSLELSLEKIDAVSVINGPGSYTGLRVGLSSAKGICYALNKPLICINTLEWLAKGVKSKDIDIVCPMIDARRMEVYTSMYDLSMKCVMQPTAMILDEKSFEESLSSFKIGFIGDGSEKWKSINQHPNASFPAFESAILEQLLLTMIKYEHDIFDDLAYAEPYYIKEFYSPSLFIKK